MRTDGRHAATHADTIRYKPVSAGDRRKAPREIRWQQSAAGETLKQIFTEAGCDESHLSEQPVKGPNCRTLFAYCREFRPGDYCRSTFRSCAGRGWSGRQLERRVAASVAVRGREVGTRKHTTIFVGFTDEEKGEVGSHFCAANDNGTGRRTDAMVNMDTLGSVYRNLGHSFRQH
jgi:hypothetical protein